MEDKMSILKQNILSFIHYLGSDPLVFIHYLGSDPLVFDLKSEVDMSAYEAVVLAVAHDEYRELDLEPSDNRVVFDIKSILKNSDGRL